MVNTGCTGCRRVKGSRKRPWSDLPTELMELILQNCNFSDQSRLRAVCRRWQSIPRIQPIKQLPWLMAFNDRDWSTCKLFDLTYKKTCAVNISTIKEYYKEIQPMNQRRPIYVCASKSGWLLLSHFAQQSLYTETAFLLYSPFTNRIINLPNYRPIYTVNSAATFSADPTSADCVFFVLHTSVENHNQTIEASTCRLGDTAWTRHFFPRYFCAIKNVVYSEGLFWCATGGGRLATFSVTEGILKVLESPSYVPLPPSYVQMQSWLVESNGDLLLVFISYVKGLRCAFKLDRSQMAWIMVEDIGDRTIFLGRSSLSLSSVPEKLEVCGKIHYCWDDKCRFLSSNFKWNYSYSNRYGPLAIKERLSKIWIEPPC